MREIQSCRSCNGTQLEPLLDFGELYVSDFVENGAGHKAPLQLVRCTTCTLVQLKHTVPSSWHYEHGYWYRSGTNEQMVAQLKDIVEDSFRRVQFHSYDRIVDIGSNDGTLLDLCRPDSVRVGFEPASDVFYGWSDKGTMYFSPETDLWISPNFFPAKWMNDPLFTDEVLTAQVIFAVAMFYDLDDPNAFADAIKRHLTSDGLFVIQMAYAPSMIATNDIGNVSHEHLEYYTVKSLANLLFRHGLMIDDVSFNDVNGGSFRCFIKHGYGGIREDPDWADLDWPGFAERVRVNQDRTVQMLREKIASGQTVAGYGASTRGNTVLQAYGIGPDLLPYIAERNPAKWGKKTVGSKIPIISEEEMRTRKPDYLFCLPFHLIESFKQREPEYVGRFIVPLPEPRIE